jgi:uroporphyrin-III C-methyltransferase
MSEDTGPVSPATDLSLRAVDPPARGRNGVGWLVALLALAAIAACAYALWRVHALERGQAEAQAAVREQLSARIDELARGADQRKRDMESLRARVGDADSVNRSLREELLGLGERSRHLEDAIANLAEQRLGARDALAMNEAEFLLQQAKERLGLFRDAQAAIVAYRLADSALAAAEDPVFASVRQSIGAELQALEAARPVETRAALGTLERLRGELQRMPQPRASVDESAPAQPVSRWRAFFQQFVRIRHGAERDSFGDRDVALARSLCALDLRMAEAALFSRDADAWKAALQRARGGLEAGFDTGAAPVRNALAELDRLAAAPFAPALPELGNALKELRNLRATRSLAQPPAAPAVVPVPAAPAATGEDA